MQRKTIILLLIAVFAISMVTSAAAGAVAGVVAVRMTAAERVGNRTNSGPSAQAQPGAPSQANPAQPNQRQPGQNGQGRFGGGGALISEVVAGSPADKAGLQVGDLVVAIGGQRLDATHTLDAMIRQSKVGDTVDLQLRRAGSTAQTVGVTLTASPSDPNTPYLGVRFGAVQPANPTPSGSTG